MKLMSKQEEKTLIGHVQSTCELVNSGNTPTEALKKVAEDNSLNKAHIRRIAEAYNQAATLSHLEEKQGSARNELFSLADPDKVISEIYPDKQEDLTEKVAYDLVRHSVKSCNRNLIASKLQKEEIESLRSPYTKEASHDTEKLKTERYFTKQSVDMLSHSLVEERQGVLELYKEAADTLARNFYNTPFEQVEGLVLSKYDSDIKPLLDSLWVDTNAEEQGQSRYKQSDGITDASRFTLSDMKTTSFASIENLVDAALSLSKRSKEKTAKESRIKEIDEILKEWGLSKSASTSNTFEKFASQKKSESFFGQALGVVGGASGKLKEELATRSRFERKVRENMENLLDPDTRDQLQQIRVQAVLNNLMDNDEVISSYDPETVINNFNKIYSVAPEAATQPGVMQSMLRRALVNDGLDAMELGQVASISSDVSRSSTDAGRYLSGMMSTVPGTGFANPFDKYKERD